MADLSTSARRNLSPDQFALPSKRAYPIEDRGHALAALGEAAAHATPRERAEIDRKVHERYPDLGKANS